MSGIPVRQQSDQTARSRWRERALYLPAAAHAIFSAPFRADPEQIVSTSVPQREEQRRSAFSRLILTCALALLIVVLLPAALLGRADISSLWRLGLLTLLVIFGLVLNTRKHTTTAGILFISSALVLVIDYLVTNPGGLDLQAVLTLALISVLILIGGLILPGQATWPLAIITITMTVTSVFLLPLAPPLRILLGDSNQIRFAIAGPLILLHVFVALFSWIAARSGTAMVQAVSRAFAREQELSQLKDQFITNVNHELRTPLMAMHGYIKLLRLRHQALSPERRGELIEKAARAGDDLVTLITSILETQHFEQTAETFIPGPTDLREALEASIRLVATEIEAGKNVAPRERALHLRIPRGIVVWAEPVRLQQIFTNLLSNAVKYSPPGSPIDISAWTVSPRRDASQGIREGLRGTAAMAEITIRDYGLGIPPEQISLLFERFVRLPRDLASNVAGNGLGLYLCRTFAETMGGKIWAESSGIAGEGTTFHLQIPLPPNEA